MVERYWWLSYPSSSRWSEMRSPVVSRVHMMLKSAGCDDPVMCRWSFAEQDEFDAQAHRRLLSILLHR